MKVKKLEREPTDAELEKALKKKIKKDALLKKMKNCISFVHNNDHLLYKHQYNR